MTIIEAFEKIRADENLRAKLGDDEWVYYSREGRIFMRHKDDQIDPKKQNSWDEALFHVFEIESDEWSVEKEEQQ